MGRSRCLTTWFVAAATVVAIPALTAVTAGRSGGGTAFAQGPSYVTQAGATSDPGPVGRRTIGRTQELSPPALPALPVPSGGTPAGAPTVVPGAPGTLPAAVRAEQPVTPAPLLGPIPVSGAGTAGGLAVPAGGAVPVPTGPVNQAFPVNPIDPGFRGGFVGLAAPVAAPAPPATGPEPAGLRVEKLGPSAVVAGDPVTYQIIVRNPAQGAVTQVRVEESVPGGTRIVETEPKAEEIEGWVVWSLGTLEGGAERRLSVTARPGREAEFAPVTRTTFAAPVPSQARVLSGQGRLGVTFTGPERVTVGGKASFRLTLTNTGQIPLTGVIVRDRLPPGLQHPAGTYIEADVGDLPPGQARELLLDTTALRAGEAVSRVQAESREGAEAAAEAVVQVEQPVKVRRLAPARKGSGREVEYQLEATNTGTAPATHVDMSEKLSDAYEFVAASDGAVYDVRSRRIRWTLDAIEPGKTRKVSVRLALRADKPGEKSGAEKLRAKPPGHGTDTPSPAEPLGAVAASGSDEPSPADRSRPEATAEQPAGKTPEKPAANHDPQKAGETPGTGTNWPITRAIVKAFSPARPNPVPASAPAAGPPPRPSAPAALGLKLLMLDDPIALGGDSSAEVRVVNRGPGTAANVRLVVTMPPGLQYLSASGVTAGEPHGSQVVFAPLPSLAAGAEAWYRLRLRGTQPGQWRCRAQLTSDQNRQPVTDDPWVQVKGE